MRVLILAADVPATPRAPGSPRVFDLLRGLKMRGHSVALVCSVRAPQRWQQFYEDEHGAQWLDAIYPVMAVPQLSFAGRVRNLASERPAFDTRSRAAAYFALMAEITAQAVTEFQCDVLQVDQLAMAQYVPAAFRRALVIDPHDAISLTEARKLSLDHSNAPKRILARALMRYQIEKIKEYERAVATRADAYVVNAEPDRAYLETFIPREKLHAIPNGVDTDFYHPAPQVPPKHQVVFTGAYSYAFNVDAMLHFHANILPRLRAKFPELRLLVVGAQPPPELQRLAATDPLTTVTGFVDDVRPYVWESAVFVSPLRGGTGMKNKLLNAMAMGKPIVATPISADGLGVCNSDQMLLAQDDAEFAGKVECILNDVSLAERLGNAGRSFVEREFGYLKLAERFEALYLELVAARETTHRAAHVA